MKHEPKQQEEGAHRGGPDASHSKSYVAFAGRRVQERAHRCSLHAAFTTLHGAGDAQESKTPSKSKKNSKARKLAPRNG